jgi:A/G-specific adenine glycosylase
MTLAGRDRAVRRKRGIPNPEPAVLLGWYDRQRRELPWRAAPGIKADPYRVWLSEIMLQQTRVETVARYYDRFLARFPTVEALAAAKLNDVLKLWAGLGYYARARNLHACARELVRRYRGEFPADEDGLRELPGIGAYTAAAIAAIAFGHRTAPVDGNVERVVSRLFAVTEPLPAAKSELRRCAEALVPAERAGDFAQAMMDLGATICSPQRPSCPVCPWAYACLAFQLGKPEHFPRRTAKANGKLRRGAAFVVLRADGAVLLRRRPAKGLLGGMTEVPTSEWTADDAGGSTADVPPLAAEWRRLPGCVRHVFTHFPLELTVHRARVPAGTRAPKGMRFVPLGRLGEEALPTLMRKVIAHAVPRRAEHFGAAGRP